MIGVCGGIAAYKSAELVRCLRQEGNDTRVVMTQAAQAFITPLTLQNLSGHPVQTRLLQTENEALFGHIELARWADLILIAPATAHMIAKLSQGLADDLLTNICLASTADLAIAPAMNRVMWQAAATQANINLLINRGALIWGPDNGIQACGEQGQGRLLEPQALCVLVAQQMAAPLKNLRILISAGPTREDIDPVRFISNRSSGKMGYALAQQAQQMGAIVTLISGPVCLQKPDHIQFIAVYSAADMLSACLTAACQHDIFISAAAVADYRPQQIAQQKIKKTEDKSTLLLEKTEDVLRAVSYLEADKRPFCVGFAAETQQLKDQAHAKLQSKRLDMIAANLVNQTGIGFDSDDNALSVYWQGGEQQLPQTSKTKLAQQLLLLINEHDYFNQRCAK